MATSGNSPNYENLVMFRAWEELAEKLNDDIIIILTKDIV